MHIEGEHTAEAHSEMVLLKTHTCIEGHKKPSWNLAEKFFPGGELSGSATRVGVS